MRKGGMKDPVIQGFVICQYQQSFAVIIQTANGVNVRGNLKKIPEAWFTIFRAEPGKYPERFVDIVVAEQMNPMKRLLAKGLQRL
jgi:hypothetical protein